ncbi:hypothetical protein M408DRAFT_184453 [Serendipita vermifera MAFF 305830]|uniref:Uncharacterized protein n=1 Tax=Serendipita vermifera MAFF 305830 TaxID=933852 RepID=A0A0C3BKS9_SERVB|nr:hypothetical protein M408DRAFT_184453 [Serendipita vermifera MAFF 305830]
MCTRPRKVSQIVSCVSSLDIRSPSSIAADSAHADARGRRLTCNSGPNCPCIHRDTFSGNHVQK